ncbi:MAG: glycosyltransferase [Lentisphaeria bacterium]
MSIEGSLVETLARVRSQAAVVANPAWLRELGVKALERCNRVPFGTLTKGLIVALLLGAAITTQLNWQEVASAREALAENPLGRAFLVASQFFLVISVAFFAWQLYRIRTYRPASAAADADLPTCTVVVPAYNEGRQVLVTLRSLMASDYPAEKLQIIAVDDGSRDDTWQWILQAGREMPGRITTLQLPRNCGKRRALYEGFVRATGEVLVTVDSDSIVEPVTLRRLVSPFVGNPRCGAVAGNVRVLNLHEGIIPRMLDVSFVFSFDFVRSGQSSVNSVLCTPGALAAYRRDVLFKVLNEWMHQRFFGKPSDIGEDRAMTNLVLREGLHVLFQSDAVVYTNVPTRYKNLCKMLLRWARSNIRENIAMSEFAFRSFREGSAAGARAYLCMQWLWTASAPLFLTALLCCILWRPDIFLLNVLCGIGLWSSMPALVYLRRHRSSDALWAYAYGIFNFAALSWIGPYSLVTMHKGGWLTRHLPAATGAAAFPAAAAPARSRAAA